MSFAAGDLTSEQTTWDAAQRTGSRGIFVWESTDLVNWGNERLVMVEDTTAGMVWAPEAIWDPAKGMETPSGCQDRVIRWKLTSVQQDNTWSTGHRNS